MLSGVPSEQFKEHLAPYRYTALMWLLLPLEWPANSFYIILIFKLEVTWAYFTALFSGKHLLYVATGSWCINFITLFPNSQQVALMWQDPFWLSSVEFLKGDVYILGGIT